MTQSIDRKALIFTHAADRPETYGASSRFATMPSSPCSRAALKSATPFPGNPSDRRIAPIGWSAASRRRRRSRNGCFVRSSPSRKRTSKTSYTTGTLLRSLLTALSSR